MSKKSSAPQAPDTSAISNAQAANATADNATSQAQLNWARSQGNTDQATTDQAVRGSLAQQDALNANSATDRATYNNTAPGALNTLQTDANNYSNPGFRDQQVGAAEAGVAQSFNAARNNSTQQLESFGVNPASTRFGALDIGTRMEQAANEAAAGTNAGNVTDATGRALQQQVYQDASPLAGQATSESVAGTGAGNTAVNEGLSTTATGASAQGTGAQWTGLGNSALSGQANTVNTGYKDQLDQFNANSKSSSGIGSLLGAGLGAVGTVMGGPIGGMIGGAVGSALGGANKGTSSSQLSAARGGPITTIRAAVGGPTASPDATPGGAIPAGASPTRGQATDDVPARLTVGEYVMPKDVTAWLGQKHFQNLIDKAREQATAATAKPAVGHAPPARPTFSSTPQQGAIPTSRAA